MSNLQTYYHFNLDLKKWNNIPEASGQSTAPDATGTNSCKAWNSPVENPSTECKHDIKKSEGNMFNPIFTENVQGRKHPGSCAFAELKQLSYREPKLQFKKLKMAIKFQ